MSDSKKVKYIKVKDNLDNEQKPPKKKRKNKKKSKLYGIKKTFAIIGTTLVSLVLIVIITGCIIATALTIYVMEFADNTFDVDLKDVQLKFTSFIYAYDKDGAEVELKRLAQEENRVWTDISTLPAFIPMAFVCVEDKRFYDHEGVDWRRTFYSFIDMMLNITGSGQGGSTITQQLVKNITGDDETTPDRKIREIFRAMSLESKYTKTDILESYINRAGLGGMVYGIGAASNWYFNKDVTQITIAEAALLAGLVRSPVAYSPYVNLTNAKTRQMYALDKMFEEGAITLAEYNAAKVEKIQFKYAIEGDDFGYIDQRSIMPEAGLVEDDEEEAETEITDGYSWHGEYKTTMSWYTDAALDQIIKDFADLKGISYDAAESEIYNGGYKMYLNVDLEKQAMLEEKFKDPYSVLTSYNAEADSTDLLQAAYVLIDYKGRVLALAGGIGDKPGDRCFNRATQATRAPGSTIKPISEYSLAVDLNIINWSTPILDEPLEIKDYSAISDTNPEGLIKWPENYEKTHTGEPLIVWRGLMASKNTIAARLCQLVSPQTCYDHLTRRLGFTTLTKYDIDLSPIALGALTNGVKIIELASAYEVFGNGGVHYDPKLYSKVLGPNGNVVLEPDEYGLQAIGKDTAWVMNRMVATVVNGDPWVSTGHLAKIDGVEVIGKTGTSNDMKNLLFVGCTPQFVGAYWLGYDNGKEIAKNAGWKAVAAAWKNLSEQFIDFTADTKFIKDSTVLELNYCTETGGLATSYCPMTEIGYFKQSFIPAQCDSTHGTR